MKYAEIGSISTSTLRTEDLLAAFADALENLVQDNADYWCGRQGERDTLCTLVWDARECADCTIEDDENGPELLDALTEALERFAPESAYFGAHPGDGADFGFWHADEE